MLLPQQLLLLQSPFIPSLTGVAAAIIAITLAAIDVPDPLSLPPDAVTAPAHTVIRLPVPHHHRIHMHDAPALDAPDDTLNPIHHPDPQMPTDVLTQGHNIRILIMPHALSNPLHHLLSIHLQS